MITWIQQTFQHHFRTLFAILLAITIVSFIVTIGAGSGIRGAERKSIAQPYFGLNLSAEEDRRKVFGDASLSVYLLIGFVPPDEGRLQEYAFSRYAAIALADQLHVPAPTQAEITDHIKGMSRFAGENGQFDPKKYAEFRDGLKKGSNSTEGDISRVLADNIRVERVQKLLGGPGFVLPSEIKRDLAGTDTSWTLGVATVDYAAYNPAITPTEAELTKFFADNNTNYLLPAKVSVSAIEFPAASFLSLVNVTEPDVRSYYDSNPARFPKPAEDKKLPMPPTPTPPNPAADYALVRPQVEMALKLEKAQTLAAKEASDFAVFLYERKLPFGSPDLAKFVAQHHASLKDIPPFSEREVPPALGSNPQIGEEAFRLNKERYFSDALPTQTGSVIVVWKETIPARQPELAEVRAKVSADYVEQEKRKRFFELGQTVRTQLAARLKTGEAFEKAVEAVASAQKLKMEAKVHPAFTVRQRPQDLDMAVLNTLEHLQKNEVSTMIGAANSNGLLVYAVDKKVPEIDEANPQYTATRTQLAQNSSSVNASEYLRQLIEAERAKSPAALR